MVRKYPTYYVSPGEEVKVTKGSGCYREPEKVEVVEEFPTFLLLKFYHRQPDGTLNSYNKAFHKGRILSGDAVIMRATGGCL